eukprot:gnl/TRDRNA2_/TRDRNA2_174405_c0_seq1.p1 gnl/TRDRNA2_/TRDRNA2_174405_c0~~gnl/TRDRNA2_/TRDRNA2_174405_c0_seq1.p1  ORF type:complete len:155 (+),score=15.48 gnl/TRDRNA2_/TRDRNA2_174405_c0_seq1:56-520(+)
MIRAFAILHAVLVVHASVCEYESSTYDEFVARCKVHEMIALAREIPKTQRGAWVLNQTEENKRFLSCLCTSDCTSKAQELQACLEKPGATLQVFRLCTLRSPQVVAILEAGSCDEETKSSDEETKSFDEASVGTVGATANMLSVLSMVAATLIF